MPFDSKDPQWVAAGKTRNYFQEEPLLDWLDLYGKEKGFVSDYDDPLYDVRTCMTTFIFAKGKEFESKVVALLRQKCEVVDVDGSTTEERAQHTVELLQQRPEVIYHGVVFDEASKTFGYTDLLVRCDVLHRICANPPTVPQNPIHYVVVDIKYKSLKVTLKGMISSSHGNKAQQFIYNRALGSMQGYTPNEAYIMARSYESNKERNENCFHMLGKADMHDNELQQKVDEAIHWIRKVREEGRDWNVLPEPSNDWLRPHLKNTQDAPWHGAKKLIHQQIKDLTHLWYVSPKNRPKAIAAGITQYDDPRVHADLFGLSEGYAKTLHHILESQKPDAPLLMPDRVVTDRETWHPKNTVEFFVDFETVNDLNDEFHNLPERGGQPLIYMVGCGHEEEGEWRFECFICDRMDEPSERTQIDAWIAHMEATTKRLGGDKPFVFHWAPHEELSLTKAFDAARVRHPDNNWVEPIWYDFLNNVIKKEPVTVKGAYAFGLKAIANAMARNDLIETNWGTSKIDGLGAMVGGWWCHEEAERTGKRMRELDLMAEILEYNEVDCKVMWEAINYLRKNH